MIKCVPESHKQGNTLQQLKSAVVSPPTTTDSINEQTFLNNDPKLNGLNCDSPSQVKFTGSSPLNSVLPWNFDPLQVVP